MKFLNKKFVKLRGLNKRQISVDVSQITFLEEAELNCELVTNVHMFNGKWVSVGLSLDETQAVIEHEDPKEEEANMEKERKKFADLAKARREGEKMADEAIRAMNIKGRIKGWSTHTLPDGTIELKATILPQELKPEEVQPELEKA